MELEESQQDLEKSQESQDESQPQNSNHFPQASSDAEYDDENLDDLGPRSKKRKTLLDSDDEDDDREGKAESQKSDEDIATGSQDHSSEVEAYSENESEGTGSQGPKKRKRAMIYDSDEEENNDKSEDLEEKEDHMEGKPVDDSSPNKETENRIDEEKTPEKNSDDEDDGEDDGEDDDQKEKLPPKESIFDSDDEDLEDMHDKEKQTIGNEDEEEGKEEEAKEGEGEAGEEGPSKLEDSEVKLPEISSDEDEDQDTRRKVPEDFVYDFDLMMQRKKEESYRRRKRKNIDIINDNDDIIAELISQMKQAAEDDFELNKQGKAATSKLKLLPVVETQLRKIDLREAFLDAGVLGVMTDWLTPLCDRNLPNLQVRETMLRLLSEFNIVDVERLKASGIGKAVMYLFKHPKETKDNKRRAALLIASWSRPIFSLDTDFHTMSKEEREQRDFDHMTKLENKKQVKTPTSTSKLRPSDEKTLRPGDKGWIPRARVPMPSTKDYVVRPKSNVESEIIKSGSKKAVTRLDKHLKNFRERRKMMKTQRAVPISIEGRRMSL